MGSRNLDKEEALSQWRLCDRKNNIINSHIARQAEGEHNIYTKLCDRFKNKSLACVSPQAT